MTSNKKVQANRLNSAKSTGPRSASGKQRASRNSTRHGFYSRDLILPWENRNDYEKLLADLNGDLKPQGVTEALLVETMAISLWKMGRLNGIETALLDKQWREQLRHEIHRGKSDEESVSIAIGRSLTADHLRIQRYQTLLSREFYRAQQTLAAIQGSKAAAEHLAPDENPEHSD